MKGVYVIIFSIPELMRTKVGSLGDSQFQKGTYAYVGSAQHNLEKRISRHLSKKKKFFWHIDYFLQKAEIQEVWIKRNFFDECQAALEVKAILKDTSSPSKKFGASDCNCPSHLFYFPESIICLESLRKRLSFKKVDIHGNQI